MSSEDIGTGIVVGIDLGTTNSCVAVSADAAIPDKAEKIAAGRLRPVSGALVITDRYRSPLTPSAVWIDRDGTPVVGARAKNKARQSGEPPPAMFFKRDMSGSQPLRAGHATITPTEASAHVLRYLRDLAESVLDVPVRRAIITVPAFFEVGAKNATTQAGTEAGLEVVETLIEPEAAAQAYLASRAGEPAGEGVFLVYDLGGGTFDASVVEWNSETFDHLSFDGDRFLGGYDFDQAIVGLLADKTPGYNLNIDVSVPEHRALLGALLAEAEDVKIELSRSPAADLVKQNLLDCDGEPMILTVPFERAEFEALIARRIEGTVDSCASALEKAARRRPDLSAESLDGIVLVGGSSRIPLVSEALAKRFGKQPELVDPDLCVAAGAALRTAFVDRRTTHLTLGPPVVLDGRGEINGRVLTGGGLADATSAVVVLRSDDGEYTARVRPDAGGGFRFADIPVTEDETGVTVSVEVDGRTVDSHAETLRAGLDQPRGGAVLANPISVKVRSGLRTVAEEGDPVPHHVEIGLRTVNQGVLLPVPVYEGSIPIGEVVVSDLPADTPVGTRVALSVTIGSDWVIDVHARVPTVGREGRATLNLRSFESDSWDRLKDRLDSVRASWAEKRNLVDPETRITHGPRIEKLIVELEGLLEQRLDAAQATYRMTVVEHLIEGLALGAGAHLTPSFAEFEAKMADLEQLLDQLASRDAQRAAEFRAELPALRATGTAAYRAESQLDWSKAVEQVEGRIYAVWNLLVPPGVLVPSEGPSAATLRVQVLAEIARGRDQLRDRMAGVPAAQRTRALDDLYQSLLTEADAAHADVHRIDVNAPDATRALRRVLDERVAPWLARVETFPPIVDVDPE
ncbi:MAG TPA: Hsp70 family protein [Pseudonocardia sp.]|mgnify:CR=1 FL=1|uniref:Hsp70 family protein n=1 Tax=Pseudonocardia sp. TaxID=60912 RepID=UPI002B4B4622|nr:Hsp70 family protein [Pseudonocardia sp.]HLU60192.1 Hsp70 family protein [Pseudonocardia sp.]